MKEQSILKRSLLRCMPAFLLIMTVLSLSGCARLYESKKILFAMDTQMILQVWDRSKASPVTDELAALLVDMDHRFSPTDENGELYHLNRNAGESTIISADMRGLLEACMPLYEKTRGALNIALAPVVRLWGFTTGNYRVPAQEEIDAALANTDLTGLAMSATSEVLLPADMQLDLGAVGKGYASDKCLSLLRERGISSALLSLGGNICAMGNKPDGSPWKIAIADPFHEDGRYAAAVSVADACVVTSGDYQRFFTTEDGTVYHHIFDARTGRPANRGLRSVTIIASSGLLADAYSTALFVMGLESGICFYEENGVQDRFEVVWITTDGELYYTPGLSGKITISDSYDATCIR